jgi:RNase adaptor protein for sRNA GlmZ degradation
MLNVKIYSFSYKKSGIPKDESENGGGFVFDCRFIYNPGREEKFMKLTGKDKEVIAFLDNDGPMQKFLDSVYYVIESSIEVYLTRDFTSLMISFGCTGGQHRSVYAAEKLKTYIEEKFHNKLLVTIAHTEFPEI